MLSNGRRGYQSSPLFLRNARSDVYRMSLRSFGKGEPLVLLWRNSARIVCMGVHVHMCVYERGCVGMCV